MASTRCESGSISSERADKLLCRLLEHLQKRARKKTKTPQPPFDRQKTILIIHRFTELLQNEPVRLDVKLEMGEKLVVVGDLNGDCHSLLHILLYSRPPDRKFLFLGNYVKEGPEQFETLLLVMLLKIRWPEHVFTLRGCQETFEMCNLKGGITELVVTTFKRSDWNFWSSGGFQNIVFSIANAFDYLPLSAIVDDWLLCVHAGPSQWVTSRADLKRIDRPTRLLSDLRRSSVLADLLWADVDLNDVSELLDGSLGPRYFTPSRRGVGFDYSRGALAGVLLDLNCDKLIRSHQTYPEGVAVPFNRCCSIRTAPSPGEKPTGSFYHVKKHKRDNLGDDLTHDIYQIPYSKKPDIKLLIEKLISEEIRGGRKPVEATKSSCNICDNMEEIVPAPGDTSSPMFKPRTPSHDYLVQWMLTRENVPWQSLDRDAVAHMRSKERLRLAMVLFPLALDLGLLTKKKVSRSYINEADWADIKKLYPQLAIEPNKIDIADLEDSDYVAAPPSRSLEDEFNQLIIDSSSDFSAHLKPTEQTDEEEDEEEEENEDKEEEGDDKLHHTMLGGAPSKVVVTEAAVLERTLPLESRVPVRGADSPLATPQAETVGRSFFSRLHSTPVDPDSLKRGIHSWLPSDVL